MDQAGITKKVTEGLRHTGAFVSTKGLASWIGCDKGAVVTAFDEIEAAGIRLMRVRGIEGGAQFLGKRMRKAA